MQNTHGLGYLIFSALAACLLGSQCSAVTPAGTTIPLYADCTYHSANDGSGLAVTSNTVNLIVRQVCSLSCSVDSASRTVKSDESALFKLTIRNTGNGDDKFSIASSALAAGWTTGVYADQNGNGKPDPAELSSSFTSPAIAAGESYSCTVAVAPTVVHASGSRCGVTIAVASTADASAKSSVTLGVIVSGQDGIREWQMLGYFVDDNPDRLTRDQIDGEASAVPGLATADREWLDYASPSSVIDVAAALGSATNSVCYAGVYVRADADMAANLVTDTADGLRIWINGALVRTIQAPPAGSTRNATTVQFEAGWNRVLIKSAHASGAWTFSAWFTDLNGRAPGGLEVSATRQPEQYNAVSNLQISGVTTTGATVTWQTTGPASTVLRCSASGGGTVTYEDPVLTTQHSVSLTDLAPSTSYVVAAYGTGTFGYPVGSLFDVFSTEAESGPVWITQWLVDGPYKGTYGVPSLSWDPLSGEATIYPRDGLASGGRVWSRMSTDASGVLDFHNCYPGAYWCLGYAHVYVYSEVQQNAVLLVGSDDGLRAFVNGAQVLYTNVYRGLVPDQDSANITLKPGWNRLMFKVLQLTGNWALCARLTTPDGEPLPNVTYVADPYY